MKIKAPLEVLLNKGCSDKCYFRTECPQNPYIRNNRHLIPNYGEKYRYGQTITTAFVESTVNEVIAKRMVKKQQMQWSHEGAHALLQTRTAVLNRELRGYFESWYPEMRDGAVDTKFNISDKKAA